MLADLNQLSIHNHGISEAISFYRLGSNGVDRGGAGADSSHPVPAGPFHDYRFALR